jgi:hypothetical protein
MDYILSISTDKLIILGVFSIIVLFLLVYAFRDALADIAKSRLADNSKPNPQMQIILTKMEAIESIMDTRLTAMEKNLEEHVAREEEKFKNIDSKLDGGFRDLHARIDKLMDRPAYGKGGI